MENKDMPAEFYCKWWLDEREKNNENEIIIKDENGNDLKLVAVTVNARQCKGCYFDKDDCTNTDPANPMCFKASRKDRRNVIFIVAESHE